MPGAFQYKPKFVDIRVRPPSEEDKTAEDVHALKPGERACDHPGCRRPATARAPKSRDLLHEHYWFCQPHAAEYNRNWNFFAGMPEGEVRRFELEHRPFAVANLGEEGFRVVDAICSHAHYFLDEGDLDVEDETIECPKHGSMFDLNTGRPRSLPATQPVEVFATKIENDDVMIELTEGD